MKFRYIKFPTADPKRKWISRPIIPIQIEGPRGRWEGHALIDSGADRSLFSFEEGFFDAYRIKFERDRGIIEITPV